MAMGSSVPDRPRRVASYIDFGLTFPPSLLRRADRIIE
jgi:hypothetical protein